MARECSVKDSTRLLMVMCFAKTVCPLILFPQDLHEFHYEILIHSLFDKTKVLFLLFPFGLVIPINMSDDDL